MARSGAALQDHCIPLSALGVISMNLQVTSNTGQPLRICFIGQAFSIHLQRWARWFAEHGHDVHVISNLHYPIPGVTVHALRRRLGGPELVEAPADAETNSRPPWRARLLRWASARIPQSIKMYYLEYLNYPLYIARTRKLLTSLRPDVVQAFRVMFGGYLSTATGFHPVVLKTGGTDVLYYPQRWWWHWWLTRWTLRHTDVVLSNSQEALLAANALGAAPEHNHYVLTGVNLTNFYPDPGKRAATRTGLGIKDELVLISTRHLFNTIYNIDVLIQATAQVHAEIPQLRLLLIYSDASDLESTREQVAGLKLAEVTKFIGPVTYAEMPNYLRAADVFVSIASVDSTPMSLLEAMACGPVPIVSDLPNIREWVVDGKTGWIVPPRDPQAVAVAILRTLRDPEGMERFRQTNWQIIRERADFESEMRKIEAIYYHTVATQ